MPPTLMPTPQTLSVFGAPWDGTLAAAVIAGIIALVGLVWSVISWIITQRRLNTFNSAFLTVQARAVDASNASTASASEATSREQWRARFEYGLSLALSATPREQKLGIQLIGLLKDAEWATDDDRRLAIVALQPLEE